MIAVSRRQFVQGAGVAGLGLLVGCGSWPWQARAPERVYRIGFLSNSTRQPYHDAFVSGLHALGYVGGQNLVLEWRFMAGAPGGLRDAAIELVNMPVEVIVTPAEPPARAVREISEMVPVVMARSLDPVGQGLAESLARPGGSITGLTVMGVTLFPKRLELLKEAIPGISHVVFLTDALQPARARAISETVEAGRILGVQVRPEVVETQTDYRNAIEAAREQLDAVVVFGGAFIDTHRTEIADLTNGSRLPSISDEREWADIGGLMAYGVNLATFYRGAATYVDKILKGRRPADLPIEQPTTLDFIINLKTAQALGLTIPPHVLLQATEVIQ